MSIRKTELKKEVGNEISVIEVKVLESNIIDATITHAIIYRYGHYVCSYLEWPNVYKSEHVIFAMHKIFCQDTLESLMSTSKTTCPESILQNLLRGFDNSRHLVVLRKDLEFLIVGEIKNFIDS